jgi:hypothetical protein
LRHEVGGLFFGNGRKNSHGLRVSQVGEKEGQKVAQGRAGTLGSIVEAVGPKFALSRLGKNC